MNENALTQRAREAIKGGKLPHRAADRMWGGPGSGAPCALCGEPVGREVTGFELEFELQGQPPAKANYPLHFQCHGAWERALELARPRIAAAPNDHPLPESGTVGTLGNRERDVRRGNAP
jgi:hypothetical protein